jgi:hypothetical protein
MFRGRSTSQGQHPLGASFIAWRTLGFAGSSTPIRRRAGCVPAIAAFPPGPRPRPRRTPAPRSFLPVLPDLFRRDADLGHVVLRLAEMRIELQHAGVEALDVLQELLHLDLDHPRLLADAGVADQRLHDLDGQRKREGNTMTMRARPGAEHLGDGLHPSGHIGLDAREFPPCRPTIKAKLLCCQCNPSIDPHHPHRYPHLN